MSEFKDSGTISVDQIPQTPVEIPPIERPVANRDPLTGRDERFDQELGRIGRFIGGGNEKAGNIAYITVISSIIIIVIAICLSSLIEKQVALDSLNKVINGFIALITGALGYIFGSKSSKSDK